MRRAIPVRTFCSEPGASCHPGTTCCSGHNGPGRTRTRNLRQEGPTLVMRVSPACPSVGKSNDAETWPRPDRNEIGHAATGTAEPRVVWGR
jgi:hypothetical protein